MLKLDHVEQIFFSDGPQRLREAAIGFALIGFAVGSATAYGTEGGGDVRHLWFLGIGLIPATVCWFLAIALRYRHIATIPLTIALCGLSLYLFSGNPNQIAEGMTPYLPVLIGVWIAIIVEYVTILIVLLLVFRLWKKGAFS